MVSSFIYLVRTLTLVLIVAPPPWTCARRAHALHKFRRLLKTDVQSFSTKVSVRTRYLKEDTITKGCPYALKVSA